MNVSQARGPIRWFLRARGLAGVTLPPRGIYVIKERLGDADLLAHEAVHWDQYRRMGAWRFYWNYLVGLVRHGYAGHPMEREARDRSGVR